MMLLSGLNELYFNNDNIHVVYILTYLKTEDTYWIINNNLSELNWYKFFPSCTWSKACFLNWVYQGDIT